MVLVLLVTGCGDSQVKKDVERALPYLKEFRLLEIEESDTRDPAELARIEQDKMKVMNDLGD